MAWLMGRLSLPKAWEEPSLPRDPRTRGLRIRLAGTGVPGRAGAERGERRLGSQSHREDGGVGGREAVEGRDGADSGG